MIQFRYQARDRTGRGVQGQLSAVSLVAVSEHLRGRSLIAVDIRRIERLHHIVAPLRHASNAAAMIIALRTLATLLGVGLPMRRALEIIVASTRSGTLREAFSAVLASVETGEALGSAMQRHEDLFSPMTIALVHAGERGGVLFETLERHASNLEQQQTMQRKLVTTMIYPAMVLCTAIGLIIFLMVSVLPMFATLFDQLNVEQPIVLRVLLTFPRLINAPTLALIGVCTAMTAYVLQRRWKAHDARHSTRSSRIRLPIIDNLREKAATARFSRALATLLKAGVPLSEALVCVRPVLALRRFQAAIEDIGASLRDGNSLAAAIDAQGLFDPLLIHLIRVGEETGTLDTQLLRLAEWFERDFAEAAARAAALIEPLLIVGIGIVVGTIVFSVFVPLYSLIGGIR